MGYFFTLGNFMGSQLFLFLYKKMTKFLTAKYIIFLFVKIQ